MAACIEAKLLHMVETPSHDASTSNPHTPSFPCAVLLCSRNNGPLSRRDRSPCPRPTPPSLCPNVSRPFPLRTESDDMHLPSSFSSSLAASAGASPPAAAPPAAAGAAAAPPPEPTLSSSSLTSLPSSALAKSEHQIGSTSGTLAAVMRDCNLSA